MHLIMLTRHSVVRARSGAPAAKKAAAPAKKAAKADDDDDFELFADDDAVGQLTRLLEAYIFGVAADPVPRHALSVWGASSSWLSLRPRPRRRCPVPRRSRP